MKLINTAAAASILVLVGGTARAQLQLNEVYASHQGSDDQEYFELKGPTSASLDNHMILVVEGDITSPIVGALDRATDLTGLSIAGTGYFVAGDAAVTPNDLVLGAGNIIENGTQTYYIVDAGSPAGVAALVALVGTDITVPPMSGSNVTVIPSLATIIDHVAVTDDDGSAGDITSYDGAQVIGPDLCCVSPEEPPGIFRDQDGGWCLTAFLDFDDVANAFEPRTPGAANSSCPGGIVAGSDFWSTPGGLGCTFQDFTSFPIPAGFFGAGSQPFTGNVGFVGEPLAGTGLVGEVDTIVERLEDANIAGCGSQDTVQIQMVALSLKSFGSITVSFGGPTSQYDVTACLSSTFSQPTGTMTIRQEHADGGTFDSFLPVVPKLVFTKVSGASGVASATLDSGIAISFQNPSPGSSVPACWAYTDGGLGIPSSPGGTVDHDCDAGTVQVTYAATTSNFFGGVCYPGADCINPGGPPRAVLTEEGATWASHCFLPVEVECLGGATFCDASDNALASCPCANPGSDDTGCDIAQGTGGVCISVVSQNVSPNAWTITGSGFPVGPSPAVIVIRSSSLDPSTPVVFGDGLRCINSASLVRLAAASALFGSSTHTAGHSAMAGPGQFFYQLWFRNTPSTYCDSAAAFNLSNGTSMTW